MGGGAGGALMIEEYDEMDETDCADIVRREGRMDRRVLLSIPNAAAGNADGACLSAGTARFMGVTLAADIATLGVGDSPSRAWPSVDAATLVLRISWL